MLHRRICHPRSWHHKQAPLGFVHRNLSRSFFSRWGQNKAKLRRATNTSIRATDSQKYGGGCCKRGGRGRQAGVDPYLIPRRRRGGGMADEDHRRDEDVWGGDASHAGSSQNGITSATLSAESGCDALGNLFLFFPEHYSADVMYGCCLAEPS